MYRELYKTFQSILHSWIHLGLTELQRSAISHSASPSGFTETGHWSPEHCSVLWLCGCQGQCDLNAWVMTSRPVLSVLHTAHSKIPLSKWNACIASFTWISVFYRVLSGTGFHVGHSTFGHHASLLSLLTASQMSLVLKDLGSFERHWQVVFWTELARWSSE